MPNTDIKNIDTQKSKIPDGPKQKKGIPFLLPKIE